MREREPNKETINKGDLFFLTKTGTEEALLGYGLAMSHGSKELLAGVLIVDRLDLVDPTWLKKVEERFGYYQLIPITTAGDQGMFCQMQIEPESLPYLRQFPSEKVITIQKELEPLLENLPNPVFTMRWDENDKMWFRHPARLNELPLEIRQAFEKTGYGCLVAETNRGIVAICHAPDSDIKEFEGKLVSHQWQLIKMPSAPLIRLEMAIINSPDSSYKFESLMNVANESHAKVFTELANQDNMHLAFYGDGLNYRFTKIINHDEQQGRLLDGLVSQAHDHLNKIPTNQRNFDKAKAEFTERFI